MLLKAVFSSNCTNSLWKREDNRWENSKMVVARHLDPVGRNVAFQTVVANTKWDTPQLDARHFEPTVVGTHCRRFVYQEVRDNERRCQRVTTKFIEGDTKKCVLCACQFHLHQGSEKAISFPDSLNTLKKTSVQNDQSRLAHVRYVRKAEKQHVRSKTTGGADGPRPFHQFRVSENDGQDLLRPV